MTQKIEQWMKDAAAEILRQLKYGLAWESEIAGIIASHAPSEAAAQPYEQLLAEQQRNYEHVGELVPENDPEIEHNDH